MTIAGITLEKLRNSEYFQFMTDALFIVEGNDPAALNVKTAFDGLTAELGV